MPVYKLTLLEQSYPHWRSSRPSAVVVVRAASVERVRQVVSEGRPERVIPASLWRHARDAVVEKIIDPRFPPDGPEGVLDPPGAR